MKKFQGGDKVKLANGVFNQATVLKLLKNGTYVCEHEHEHENSVYTFPVKTEDMTLIEKESKDEIFDIFDLLKCHHRK